MNRKNYISLIFALSVLIVFYFIPTPPGLSYAGKMMIGVLIFGAILFVTEAIPLGMAGLTVMIVPVILGITDSTTVFHLFGNKAVFFLIGAFIIAAGFQKSGLHKRVAVKIINSVGERPSHYLFGVIIIASSLSLVMSEHGVAALLLPIVTYSLIYTPPNSNIRKGGMIALAYGCSVGSIGTLLGCGRNPYTVAFLQQTAGINITFTQWVMLALPVVLIMVPLTWFWITRIFPPEKNIKIRAPPVEKKISKSELKVAVILIITIIVLVFGRDFDVAVVVIGGAIAMFISGVLEWKDVERTIPWGVILLYGGAITMSEGLQSTGASLWIASNLVNIIGKNPQVVLFVMIVTTMLLTEFMSNTAAVALMLPIGAGLASVIPGLNIVVVSVAIALSGGFAFLFIIGTPGNLITYTTGFYKTRDLFKVGVFMFVSGVVVIYGVANTLWHIMGVW